jgi:hypothetical protein
MAIYSRWLIPERVILVDMHGKITASEFQAFIELPAPDVASLETFHTIVLTEHVETMPMLHEMIQVKPSANAQWLFLVHTVKHPIARIMASIAARVMGLHFRMVADIDEAIATLRAVDAVLADVVLPSEPLSLPVIQVIDHSVGA